MQGVNEMIARERQAQSEEIDYLKQQLKRLEARISNAQGYLKNKSYQKSAVDLAERELNLAMDGK